jgi:beta-barrel assembly-enhancing protease
MNTRYVLPALLLAVILACSLTVGAGHIDRRFDFSAAMEIWTDLIRDADRPALQLTRVSNQEEVDLGVRLAAAVPAGTNTTWDQYVEAVGRDLAQHTQRRGIPYRFHVTNDPFANAWALPGGQIYITVAMLDFLESEAELAAIVGHEIAHVDLYHCIERYQMEINARRIGVPGLGQIADLSHSLVTATYQQNQELEADSAGVRLATNQGYDPGAAEIVFARMQTTVAAGSTESGQAPVPAVARATAHALGSFLASHPPSAERHRKLAALVSRNNRDLHGRTFYIGRKNYQQRTTRAQQNLAAERITY